MTEADMTPLRAHAAAHAAAHGTTAVTARAPLSVVICAHDEEALITRAIASVAFADEVVVCDSGSTDRTRAVASAAGARVIEHRWLGYSAQKNRAASVATHDWILSLDADEVVTPRLAGAIERTLRARPDPRRGFAVDRRGTFKGRVLPNTERRATRDSYVRLYNRRYGAWDEAMPIHEVVRVPGGTALLAGVLLHDREFAMDDYFRVYNRNATAEAQALVLGRRPVSSVEVALRPVLRFLWCYLVKGDVHLGGRGLVHAALRACSDFMRYAKAWESQL
jgi:glycosyltransferase involved in cell wall biosynthesis